MENLDKTGIIVEGKTKIIYGTTDPNLVIVQSKDDITAGNGAKHDTISGKASFANQTTCNVFRLLQQCQIPIAFKEQIGAECFIAEKCRMVPFEVVIRREADGSFLKRNPHFKKGHIFSKLVLEFFLKTSRKKWQGQDIPVDDPMAIFNFKDGGQELYLPDQPIAIQNPFLKIPDFPSKDEIKIMNDIGYMAKQVFLILEKAWQLQGRKLVDFKLEFGFNNDGELRLADVIDNDSWRVLEDGNYIDKQIYRDGGDLNEVTAKYKKVAGLTGSFSLPRQQIILWRASEKDDIESFQKAISGQSVSVCVTTYSLHKQPGQAIQELTRQIQEISDSVLIVYCGRSNGAGPTLSAHCTIPTITVPAGWENCHEDVWSSIHTPSGVPVATILDPKNAVLAALQILAMRNPLLYANLRMKQEERFSNFVPIE